MKYKLIIDKNAEEEVAVTVHAPSALTSQIEELVRKFSGEDSLFGICEEEMRRLPFGEIECITVLDRRVTAIDREGKRYRIQDRLRDLEEIDQTVRKQLNFITATTVDTVLDAALKRTGEMVPTLLDIPAEIKHRSRNNISQ